MTEREYAFNRALMHYRQAVQRAAQLEAEVILAEGEVEKAEAELRAFFVPS